MPSRKHRRRRAKGRRHEYEYVYVDEEGREVEVDPSEEEPGDTKPRERRPARGDSGPSKAGRGARARQARTVPPPSFRRVLRRAALVGPLMYVVIWLTTRDAEITNAQRAGQTLILLVLFLPFSYVLDTVMYRAYRRRVGDDAPGRRR
ncbi:MAG: hypothetical protein M3M94_00535 [Actinomycetota bacterium]|nr:hypothetical protein [Actinomycetota bacterium]